MNKCIEHRLIVTHTAITYIRDKPYFLAARFCVECDTEMHEVIEAFEV